ncbi:MAG: hypothetical protein DRJ42_20445 [Deltaproteobacteria bacterium]|nr:MAG: hypothetical protein DRJ42_20445 [Deltaproteobacteria bacterium]
MKLLFGAECPGCGRPLAFTLGQPEEFRCDACGTQGRHPPEVVEQLRKADDLLRQSDARNRQFDGVQRFSLRASGVLLGIYLFVFFVAMVPAGCSAGCAVVHSVGGTPAGVMMMGLPPVILFTSGVLGLLILLWTRRSLREKSAAIPPAAPGAPARCRVCGGPLESTATDVIVRCPYCGADSVVTRGVLAGLHGRLQLATGHYSDVVSRSATAIGSGLAGLVLFPAAVLVVPVVSFLAVASLFTFYIDDREDPPDLSARYVVETVPGVNLECIGLVGRSGGRPSISFGFYPREIGDSGAYTRSLVNGAAPGRMVPITDFVGRTVYWAPSMDPLRERRWTVTGAFKPPLHNGNVLRLQPEDRPATQNTVEIGRAMVCFPPGESGS